MLSDPQASHDVDYLTSVLLQASVAESQMAELQSKLVDAEKKLQAKSISAEAQFEELQSQISEQSRSFDLQVTPLQSHGRLLQNPNLVRIIHISLKEGNLVPWDAVTVYQ